MGLARNCNAFILHGDHHESTAVCQRTDQHSQHHAFVGGQVLAWSTPTSRTTDGNQSPEEVTA